MNLDTTQTGGSWRCSAASAGEALTRIRKLTLSRQSFRLQIQRRRTQAPAVPPAGVPPRRFVPHADQAACGRAAPRLRDTCSSRQASRSPGHLCQVQPRARESAPGAIVAAALSLSAGQGRKRPGDAGTATRSTSEDEHRGPGPCRLARQLPGLTPSRSTAPRSCSRSSRIQFRPDRTELGTCLSPSCP